MEFFFKRPKSAMDPQVFEKYFLKPLLLLNALLLYIGLIVWIVRGNPTNWLDRLTVLVTGV